MKIPFLLLSITLVSFTQTTFSSASNSVKGMIVYSGSDDNGNGAFLFAVSPDGKIKKRITTGENVDVWPSVSPDGLTIAFTSGGSNLKFKYRIFTMSADGKNIKQVAETENDAIMPSWSPDGKKIAFWDRTSDHTTCLYIINPDGSNLKQIVNNAKHGDDHQGPPEWSADGKRILYDKIDQADSGNYREELFSVHTDGSGEQRVGNHKQTEREGDLSPDGSKIIYYAEKAQFNYNRFDNAGIFIMNPDGTGEKYLAAGCGPVWSPNGSLIAYTASELDKGLCIFIMYADGTGPGKPEESENSYYEDNDNSEPEKGVPLQVSFDNSPGIKEPVWSPDGKKLAFVTDTGELNDNTLYVADIQGNNPLVVAKNVVGWSRPSWK